MRFSEAVRAGAMFMAVTTTFGMGMAEAQTPRLTILARQRVFTATASALADGVFTPGERTNIVEEARLDLPPRELMQLQTRLSQLAAQYPSGMEVAAPRGALAPRRTVYHPSGRQPTLAPRAVRQEGPTLARRTRPETPHVATRAKSGTVRQAAMLLVARPFPVPPMHRPRPDRLVGRKVQVPPAPRAPSRDVSPASYEKRDSGG